MLNEGESVGTYIEVGGRFLSDGIALVPVWRFGCVFQSRGLGGGLCGSLGLCFNRGELGGCLPARIGVDFFRGSVRCLFLVCVLVFLTARVLLAVLSAGPSSAISHASPPLA